ncbi:Transcriptional regulatory protein sds3 [Neolecta irregularis DAH-3]|uniref:Transcriptional regulatory protein sds3 n=1 Tax=Neolecta irregularis (strain DAH-3) TaxID=1198029 RepID=A0A1U7LHT8_NEOID|nr:Transcriptional regulatory protein sds3 [Neolecta irregularis DAH-3]|eukprot:OLL22091.1 Transcriptional regulatory protein sds3 [Neolecta irregularis DAH-3]
MTANTPPTSPSSTSSAPPRKSTARDLALISRELESINTRFEKDVEGHFRANIAQLQSELLSLNDGTHPEYLAEIELVEKTRDDELENVDFEYEYKLHRAKVEYEEEIESANEEYQTLIQTLKSTISTHLCDRRRKLREERDTGDLTNIHDPVLLSPEKVRKLRKRGGASTGFRRGYYNDGDGKKIAFNPPKKADERQVQQDLEDIKKYRKRRR